MLEFWISFAVYALAFFVGSVLAAQLAKRRYPAQSEAEAFEQLALQPDQGEELR